MNVANGLGNTIPEDASMVMVLGPQDNFLEEETQSLIQYHKSGGNLFISLEPTGTDLTTLLDHLGLSYQSDVYLANDTIFVPRTNKPVDRRNLASNKYSNTHPSVTTLSRNSKELVVIFPESWYFGKHTKAKPKATIRSMENTFEDKMETSKRSRRILKIWSLAVSLEKDIEQGRY